MDPSLLDPALRSAPSQADPTNRQGFANPDHPHEARLATPVDANVVLLAKFNTPTQKQSTPQKRTFRPRLRPSQDGACPKPDCAKGWHGKGEQPVCDYCRTHRRSCNHGTPCNVTRSGGFRTIQGKKGSLPCTMVIGLALKEIPGFANQLQDLLSSYQGRSIQGEAATTSWYQSESYRLARGVTHGYPVPSAGAPSLSSQGEFDNRIKNDNANANDSDNATANDSDNAHNDAIAHDIHRQHLLGSNANRPSAGTQQPHQPI